MCIRDRETATSREDFIDQMKARGYGVDWKDSHKYITLTDLERQSQGVKQCKVRNNKLEKYYAVDFGKESLEPVSYTHLDVYKRQEYSRAE